MYQINLSILVVLLTFATVVKCLTCPPQEDPEKDVFFPNMDDCSTYYQCLYESPILMHCPPGQHWNAAANWCDYPENAKCGDYEETSGESIEHPTTEEYSTILPNSDCPLDDDPTNPTLLPAEDCTKFYKCDNGYAYLLSCPGHLEFNVAANQCDYPINSNCSVNDESYETPATLFCPYYDDPVNPTYFEGSTCDTYYICEHTKLLLRTCPKGLHWNQAATTCDWPASVNCQLNK